VYDNSRPGCISPQSQRFTPSFEPGKGSTPVILPKLSRLHVQLNHFISALNPFLCPEPKPGSLQFAHRTHVK